MTHSLSVLIGLLGQRSVEGETSSVARVSGHRPTGRTRARRAGPRFISGVQAAEVAGFYLTRGGRVKGIFLQLKHQK
jgi:hypothetical protein